MNDFGGEMIIFKWAEKQPTTYRKSLYVRTAYSNPTLMDSTQGNISKNSVTSCSTQVVCSVMQISTANERTLIILAPEKKKRLL